MNRTNRKLIETLRIINFYVVNNFRLTRSSGFGPTEYSFSKTIFHILGTIIGGLCLSC